MTEITIYGSKQECEELSDHLSSVFPQWDIDQIRSDGRKIEVYSEFISTIQLQDELDYVEETTDSDIQYSQTAIMLMY